MSLDDIGVEHLSIERSGPVAWCRINRPGHRNALTPAMYAGLGTAISLANTDPDVEALIITGTDDVFIPGGDLGSLDGGLLDDRLSAVLPWPQFRTSAVPVITAINGLCFASGVMFALLSDVAIASDRAAFRLPELERGFPDMWMASVLPAHVGVGRARELLLTNRKFGAAEALDIGVIERVVPHDELEAAAEAVAYEVLATAPHARNLVRHVINARYGVVDENTMNWAATSSEVQEGFTSYLEKRPPAWSVDLRDQQRTSGEVPPP